LILTTSNKFTNNKLYLKIDLIRRLKHAEDKNFIKFHKKIKRLKSSFKSTFNQKFLKEMRGRLSKYSKIQIPSLRFSGNLLIKIVKPIKEEKNAETKNTS
jgi:hypothetical protein